MNYKKPKFGVICIAIVACVAFLAVFFTVNKGNSYAADSEFITYEFETYDGEEVVINSDNIILQEKSEDPSNSEHITSAAADNIIAPGRDYLYLSDENYYYVADYYNGLITVANKTSTEYVDIDDVADDNPGYFETESISISYNVKNFFGYKDGDTIFLNNTNAVAGTSLIQISESECTSIEDALKWIAASTGFELSKAESYNLNGYNAVYTSHILPDEEEGVIIDDIFLIVENNGKVILIDEMITRDDDKSRAESLEKEFSETINTIKFK